MRQIFAFSGAGAADPEASFRLTSYPLSLAPRQQAQRVCYLATALGDDAAAIASKAQLFASHRPEVRFSALRLFPQPSVVEAEIDPDLAAPPHADVAHVRGHLLAQDVILVEGGSVVNLMAVWRAHGLPTILRECWDAGIVLSGGSAGSLCWHLGGPTDSFSNHLDPFIDGLGLLPWSNGVHDDATDQPRRATYRRLVGDGTYPAGYATEDGVGLHYVETALHEAVSVTAGKAAWYVEPSQGGFAETRIDPRSI